MDNINEVSPKGWGGTTSAMKKHHPEIKNPWALAYWMRSRDFKSHYKNDPEGTKSKKEPKKKDKYKDEDKSKKKIKFKEWLELRERKEHKKKKKVGIKLAWNIEGEPTEIEEGFDQETARVAHSAITRLGYGMGRPKIQGNNLVYNTADPEDAEMIAGEIPQQIIKWGINSTANAQGRDIIVTLNT